MLEGFVPREVHEHQSIVVGDDGEALRDNAGKHVVRTTGYTVVHRESEWDDVSRERVFRLAEYRRQLCPCGCGVTIDKAWDPAFEPWSVDTWTCYARRALDRTRLAWEDSHKDDKPGWSAGIEHFVMAPEEGSHNPELAAKIEDRRARARRGD